MERGAAAVTGEQAARGARVPATLATHATHAAACARPSRGVPAWTACHTSFATLRNSRAAMTAAATRTAPDATADATTDAPARSGFAAPTLSRRLVAEFAGTLLLLAIVVGSGVMGDALSADDAVALLGNTVATGAGLVVLVLVFGPVSGAHFNPAVTLGFWMRGEIGAGASALYVLVQLAGAVAGVWLAHVMFDLPVVQAGTKARAGLGQAVGEAVATFALLLAIFGTVRRSPAAVPYAVGLVITAGYWWTSSTSFANPAVSVARSLTDTFAGIRAADVPVFVAAQLAAATGATLFWRWMEPVAVEPATVHGTGEVKQKQR